jgi:hypothetical protein
VLTQTMQKLLAQIFCEEFKDFDRKEKKNIAGSTCRKIAGINKWDSLIQRAFPKHGEQQKINFDEIY